MRIFRSVFRNSFKVLIMRRCGRVSRSGFECLLSATIVAKRSMSDVTRFLVPLKPWAGGKKRYIAIHKTAEWYGCLKHFFNNLSEILKFVDPER